MAARAVSKAFFEAFLYSSLLLHWSIPLQSLQTCVLTFTMSYINVSHITRKH